MDAFFYPVLLAGAVSGAAAAFLGVFIVGMRMPFIGTCIAHAAMAGTIFASLLGVHPLVGAVGFSILTALSLAAIPPQKSRLDTNVGLAIVFSLMLGLTFLGMGLAESGRGDMLALLWGSILFVRKGTVITITVLAALLAVFGLVFNKELKALLFSRSIAAATGIHERFVYAGFLMLCGLTLALNLEMIGGLMIFSLITNPAAAAYQLCKGHTAVVLMSVLLGMFSATAGFLLSLYWNLPTGACIVLVSTLIFAAAAVARRLMPQLSNQ
ncbi:MAG: metal ABC transporter permease [Phycisphaerae bacterium]|nr:metal ABC transporter permease [Phycisphaerae bacterium]